MIMDYLSDFEKVLINSGVDFVSNKVIDDYFLTGKPGVVRDVYKSCQENIAQRMVTLAEIDDDDLSIHEPGAGHGVILKLISGYRNHSYCEIENEFIKNYLLQISTNFETWNFLKNRKKYDRIIINPPFNFGQYKKHILHAWENLNSKGILVFLYPKNSIYLTIQNRKFIEFLQGVVKEDVGSVCGLCECVIGKIVKP